MKYKKYSFRNAEVIFENDEKYKEDYSQILNVLDNITEEEICTYFNNSTRNDIKSFSEPINTLIDEKLTKKKHWHSQVPIFNESEYRPSSTNDKNPWTIDFASPEIAIEVAFNHGRAVAWNLIKLVLASELNHVEKAINTSAGVIICATDDFKRTGGFDGAIGSYEKYLQHLKPMQNQLTVPIMIIGLESLDNYSIHNKTIYNNADLSPENTLPKNTKTKVKYITEILKEKNIPFEENNIVIDGNIINNSIKIKNIEVKIIPNTVYKKLSPSQKEKYFNLKDFISKIDIEKIISKYENK